MHHFPVKHEKWEDRKQRNNVHLSFRHTVRNYRDPAARSPSEDYSDHRYLSPRRLSTQRKRQSYDEGQIKSESKASTSPRRSKSMRSRSNPRAVRHRMRHESPPRRVIGSPPKKARINETPLHGEQRKMSVPSPRTITVLRVPPAAAEDPTGRNAAIKEKLRKPTFPVQDWGEGQIPSIKHGYVATPQVYENWDLTEPCVEAPKRFENIDLDIFFRRIEEGKKILGAKIEDSFRVLDLTLKSTRGDPERK